LSRDKLSIPTMEFVPVPLVPTCPTKWVYKAVKLLSIPTNQFTEVFSY